jgi:hypothetical protein
MIRHVERMASLVAHQTRMMRSTMTASARCEGHDARLVKRYGAEFQKPWTVLE